MPDLPYLPYGKHVITEDDVRAVATALRSSHLTSGPEVAKFEAALTEVTNSKHAIAVSNGTLALALTYMAHDLKPNDAVIVPAVTFVATANAAVLCGAQVEFADVDQQTGLMSPAHARSALERARKRGLRPRMIVPVHLGGQTEDAEALAACAEEQGVALIEDACHSLGGSYASGEKIGSCHYAEATCFSFHAVKTIAMGEGGAIAVSNDALASRIRRLRDHGLERSPKMMSPQGLSQGWAYEMLEPGLNARVSDTACALGRSQLSRLASIIEEKAALSNLYDRLLKSLAPTVYPVPRRPGISGWHLYRVLIDFEKVNKKRPLVMSTLAARGVGTQVHYIPLPLQPYYRSRLNPRDFPGAVSHFERTLSLPFFTGLSEADVRRVCENLSEVVSKTC